MTQTLRPPRGINLFNALAKPLLAAGMPMGFNGLLTVTGRKTGLPRTTALAIIEDGDRRWVWAPWGEVHWVRNLRAAGRATITVRRQEIDVRAVELDAGPARRVLSRHARADRATDARRVDVHPEDRWGRRHRSGDRSRRQGRVRAPRGRLTRYREPIRSRRCREVNRTRCSRYGTDRPPRLSSDCGASVTCPGSHLASRSYRATRPSTPKRRRTCIPSSCTPRRRRARARATACRRRSRT